MADLGVPALMLTHLLPPPSTPQEAAAFADDIRAGGYGGTVMVCNDLDRFVLAPGAS